MQVHHTAARAGGTFFSWRDRDAAGTPASASLRLADLSLVGAISWTRSPVSVAVAGVEAEVVRASFCGNTGNPAADLEIEGSTATLTHVWTTGGASWATSADPNAAFPGTSVLVRGGPASAGRRAAVRRRLAHRTENSTQSG